MGCSLRTQSLRLVLLVTLILAALSAQADTSRYVPQGATVIDRESGLQWMRCNFGQQWNGSGCAGVPTTYRWQDARTAAVQLNRDGGYEGYSDWRLPTLDELLTLVYCSSGQPAMFKGTNRAGCGGRHDTPTIASSIFPSTVEGWYWTSTSSSSDLAWSVAFHYGYADVDYKSFNEAVRLVRTADL
ncbi:MAG: DUF1566 domain-containing protein [Natronospirillum sp.]